jgi:hypothetical protein
MDRITIEPAIKIILGQIKQNSTKPRESPRQPTPAPRRARSPRAWLSRWISSN